MLLTHYQRVYFTVAGRNVDSKRGDPLIAKFRKALEELEVNKDSVSATVYDVDSFEIQQKNRDLYAGKYLIRWEIVDNEVGWESRMNHHTRALLSRAILAIFFSHYKMEIKATDVRDGTYE